MAEARDVLVSTVAAIHSLYALLRCGSLPIRGVLSASDASPPTDILPASSWKTQTQELLLAGTMATNASGSWPGLWTGQARKSILIFACRYGGSGLHVARDQSYVAAEARRANTGKHT